MLYQLIVILFRPPPARQKFFMRHTTARYRNAEGGAALAVDTVCPLGGNCRVEGPGRGKCPHCRYRKCLDLGMTLTRKWFSYVEPCVQCNHCATPYIHRYSIHCPIFPQLPVVRQDVTFLKSLVAFAVADRRDSTLVRSRAKGAKCVVV